MNELTVADLTERIDALRDEIADIARKHDQSMAVIQTLLARFTDLSHVTKAEAALILSQRWHRRISVRTVERMIERRIVTYEKIPGTQHSGIPMTDIEKAERSFVSTRALSTARERHGRKAS